MKSNDYLINQRTLDDLAEKHGIEFHDNNYLIVKTLQDSYARLLHYDVKTGIYRLFNWSAHATPLVEVHYSQNFDETILVLIRRLKDAQITPLFTPTSPTTKLGLNRQFTFEILTFTNGTENKNDIYLVNRDNPFERITIDLDQGPLLLQLIRKVPISMQINHYENQTMTIRTDLREVLTHNTMSILFEHRDVDSTTVFKDDNRSDYDKYSGQIAYNDNQTCLNIRLDMKDEERNLVYFDKLYEALKIPHYDMDNLDTLLMYMKENVPMPKWEFKPYWHGQA